MKSDERQTDRRDALGIFLVALAPVIAVILIVIALLAWVSWSFSVPFD